MYQSLPEEQCHSDAYNNRFRMSSNFFMISAGVLSNSLAISFCFSGGMIMNSFLVYWLTSQYPMDESVLGALFSVSSLITTPSLWVAAWLGNRIGLVNTMVFTHLPANCGLIVLPFMPNVNGVCAVMVFRAMLSSMDVPARDAFMMNVVDPEERVACSSFISTMRAVSCAAGPLFAALLWDICGAAAPLIIAGILKCIYDISLLVSFRAIDSTSERSCWH